MTNQRAITWSYGGGTQSAAIAVLVAQGKLPKPEVAVIADTGREATETWDYLRDHIQPLLNSVGVDIHVAPRSLANVDLYKGNSLLLPVFTRTGKFTTFCSMEWKTYVIQRWLRSQGYGPKRSVKTWIGFSLDEVGRMKKGKLKWQQLHWPLLFDVSPALTREDCKRLVIAAGLPPPPRSSCWMCPHRQNDQWQRLKDFYPQDWAAAVKLDEEVRANDREQGVYLHHSRQPLAEADLTIKPEPEHPLFGRGEGCESGQCMT